MCGRMFLRPLGCIQPKRIQMTTHIVLPAETIGQKINTSKIIALAVGALVGIALVCAAGAWEYETTSSAYMLLASAGYIVLFGVAIAAFTKKKQDTYAPTGSPLVYRTVEFSTEEYDAVRAALDQGAVERLRAFRPGHGARMRLCVAYSKDRQFAAYQFFKYESYEYLAQGDLCVVEDPDRVVRYCI